ncbi:alpha,alpha-phosphotrehalase, partial [Enterococcus sp. S181_ASV_20]|nr:alpha,alpha-phosphotrehalase [Enterococcus sp. S181_ASV_20]
QRQMCIRDRSEQEAFEIVKAKSRDNSRTPMQWDSSEYGGFSKTDPWLGLGKSADEINVAKQLKEGSIFTYFHKLIKLRKEYPVI